MIKVKDIQDKYGEYEVDEIELEKILKKQAPKSVWDLKDVDTYWSIYFDKGILKPCAFVWLDNTYLGPQLRLHGLVFLTEQEAQEKIEEMKIEAELLKLGGRKGFKFYELNYAFYLNCEGEIIVYDASLAQQTNIYFDTREQAENAIKIIGEDRLKKYWFKVEE